MIKYILWKIRKNNKSLYFWRGIELWTRGHTFDAGSYFHRGVILLSSWGHTFIVTGSVPSTWGLTFVMKSYFRHGVILCHCGVILSSSGGQYLWHRVLLSSHGHTFIVQSYLHHCGVILSTQGLSLQHGVLPLLWGCTFNTGSCLCCHGVIPLPSQGHTFVIMGLYFCHHRVVPSLLQGCTFVVAGSYLHHRRVRLVSHIERS